MLEQRPCVTERRSSYVWLSTPTLKIWQERKVTFGLKNITHKEFADALLHGKALQGAEEWVPVQNQAVAFAKENASDPSVDFGVNRI